MEKIAYELAHAKLTRSLEVVGVRDDGYHLIRSEMLTIELADRLQFRPGTELNIRDEIAWTCAREIRPKLDLAEGPSNLVSKALSLVGERAEVLLEKRIPPGAGLGGGSADAAAVLRRFGYLDYDRAASLGADVPFCIRGGRAMVSGIGERVDPLPFVELGFVVVTPGIAVSTAAVYAAYDELGSGAEDQNYLTRAAFRVEPRLARWRDFLAETTDRDAVLAGSGSSLFVECAPAEVEGIAERVRKRADEEGNPVLVTAALTVPGTF